MTHFVNKNSIVRDIWGNSDTILLIFVETSAEFALNKAVDGLYFTGKLPKNPLDRLFSTVSYAHDIVFAEHSKALQSIGMMNKIHGTVEEKRGNTIPEWDYKNVLYMLIDYSIRSYEILERKLEPFEKQEVLNVFGEVRARMGLNDIPKDLETFNTERHLHLKQDLYNREFTQDLYKQYRNHIGFIRYYLLIETQIMICPKLVSRLLQVRKFSVIKPLISIYKLSRLLKFDALLKAMILPSAYKSNIQAMNTI